MNMIFKLFSAGALMFLGVACTSCEKENENNKESDIPMEQVSYKASNEIIVNPERGFYKATSCEMGTSGALSVSTLKNYRANGYSLIFRYFYLENFRDKALTDEALQFFDKDMAYGASWHIQKPLLKYAQSPDGYTYWYHMPYHYPDIFHRSTSLRSVHEYR